MECKIIDLYKYKTNTLNELETISVDALNDYHIDTLLLIVTAELIDVNKQLCILKRGSTKIIKNEYKYFSNVKKAFLRIFDKIEDFYINKKVIVLNFYELDCILGAIESCMQDIIVWKGKENSKEYINIVRLYRKLKPLYDTFRTNYENSNLSH